MIKITFKDILAVTLVAGLDTLIKAQQLHKDLFRTRAPDVISAREFRLVGKDGSVRALINEVDGEVGLHLFDEAGKLKGAFFLDAAGEPFVSFYGNEGKCLSSWGAV